MTVCGNVPQAALGNGFTVLRQSNRLGDYVVGVATEILLDEA